ncbi:MAG: D-alanyl-D-alanine carboxypeptidase family protein [Acaryochloris sp. SU_5_25]|nr:D-alanyl-D-alanine carboxypeptidase family protein [Acaryochloris sp. SU_5_25]
MKWFQRFFSQFQFVAISALTTGVIVWLAASMQIMPSALPPQSQAPSSPLAELPASETPLSSATSDPTNTKPLYDDLPLLPHPSPAQTANAPTITSSNAAPSRTYFGHLPYAEDEKSRLVSVGEFVRGTYRRTEYLDQEAATAFSQLVAAAVEADLTLQPISGFRSVKDQEELFQKQVQKHGSEAAAAKLSAPPGYSEHHTGYAVDIADRNQPELDLKLAFADTTAYRWLTTHAGTYGFELSFPRNNAQGVSFEPWHWRYVGTQRAAVQFAIARR